jgi:DNA replication protein DnaC
VDKIRNEDAWVGTEDRIKNVDTLIIDEISMISAKIFQQAEYVCRKIRNNSNIFGGLPTYFVRIL